MTRLKVAAEFCITFASMAIKIFAAGILFGLAIDSFYIFPLPFCIHIAYSLVSDWAFSDMFPGRRFSAGVFITIPPNLP
jgi:hypothetical protein